MPPLPEPAPPSENPERFPRNVPPGEGPEGNPSPIGPDDPDGPLTTHPAPKPYMPEAIPSKETSPGDDD